MKLLHISDLHFQKSRVVLDNLADSINEAIDICVFTGDLVNKFSVPLNEAYDVLSDFAKTINCNKLCLCCGNHDIDRNNIKQSFQSFVAGFKNDSDINNYIKENKANDFIDNLKHLNDYNNLLKTKVAISDIDNLHSIYRYTINTTNVVIVDLNFSWCAFYEENKNKLLYPSFLVKNIVKSLKKDDFNILITHFPLSFLNDNCRKQVSNLIYNNFDCHLAGHSHENEISHYQYSENGLFTSIASSTMDNNKPQNIGYSILDLDVNKYEVIVNNYIYHTDKFILESNNKYDIPSNEDKKNELKLFESINTRFVVTLEKANHLFVPTSGQNNISFNNIFTEPNIKTKGFNKQYEMNSASKLSNKSLNVRLTEFKSDTNYLVYGKEKSGKTVFLYKLLLDHLEHFAQLREIPIYIDLRNVYSNDNYDFNLESEIQQQYSVSKTFIQNCFGHYKIKYLIDNYNAIHKKANLKLFKLLKDSINCSYIITTTYVFDSMPFNLDELIYSSVYIHDISRSNIRELTNKWPSEKVMDKNDIFKKMVMIFSQLNIHFNYWTVSMFLSIIEKTDNLKLHNNSELIDLYVENLLDKQTLSLTPTKTFSYDNLRSFLSSLAIYLYKEKKVRNYCATYFEIVACYESFKQENPRVVTEVKLVIDYLLDKGIIINIAEDCYTFRLNGIFEYFLAYYMFKNPEFKYEIVNQSETYLSFKNELEIYSGLQRDDFEFLLQIYYNTEDALNLLRVKYTEVIDYETIIGAENSDAKNLLEFAANIKNELEPISYESQDLMDDQIRPICDVDSSVQLKKNYKITDIDANLYAEHLSILGRVIRNLDDIKGKDNEMLKHIFNFLIDQSCLTVYYLIQEFIDHIGKSKTDLKNLKEFSSFISTFSPLITHAFLFENVSHPTLSIIIEEEIHNLKTKPAQNQFKLFVLYFLLIESNIEVMHPKIDEIIDIAKHWNIRQSIFFKLMMLIAFKCEKKPELCNILKKYIEKIHAKLYPGKDSHKQPKSNKDVINKILKQFEQANNDKIDK
jgi:predicted phosphodiesterase